MREVWPPHRTTANLLAPTTGATSSTTLAPPRRPVAHHLRVRLDLQLVCHVSRTAGATAARRLMHPSYIPLLTYRHRILHY
jgi:hypothetical protein